MDIKNVLDLSMIFVVLLYIVAFIFWLVKTILIPKIRRKIISDKQKCTISENNTLKEEKIEISTELPKMVSIDLNLLKEAHELVSKELVWSPKQLQSFYQFLSIKLACLEIEPTKEVLMNELEQMIKHIGRANAYHTHNNSFSKTSDEPNNFGKFLDSRLKSLNSTYDNTKEQEELRQHILRLAKKNADNLKNNTVKNLQSSNGDIMSECDLII
ncbi:hypothetical protein M0802_006096 [Mischocyttarus mexicanus]|nr:hypothetical protein M0802_006096 [Mischocyttarus mexicanus]